MARKEKKYHFIYKTTNLLSGKYYIGMHSTDNLDDGYLGSGNRLRRSINKYGKENFIREVLEFCDSREELASREGEIINLDEIAKKDCINLVVGGKGFGVDDYQKGCSKKGCDRVKFLFENDKLFLKKHSERMSKVAKQTHKEGKFKTGKDVFDWTNKKHSEETKKKMSDSSKGVGKGKTNSQYGTCWITKDGENKKIKKESQPQYELKGWESGRK